MTDKTIIEVNGVKLEVDLRTCKVVDHLAVGDSVKVLIKDYNGYKSYPGVIVGFDNFKELPTVIISYCEHGYSNVDMKYVYYNSKSENVEVIAANEHDMEFSKADVLKSFDRQIDHKSLEIKEIERKKEYFLNHFQKYFNQGE
jgi:hypothetical protein